MNWFNKIERKYGKYAIKNLMVYVIALYVIGLIVDMFYPGVYSAYLSLNAQAILHGQIWRIITFMIEPPSSNLIFIIFVLYFYYMIGTVLEKIWGAFKFNVYFFSGVLLQVIAAILIYLIFNVNFTMSTYFINMALFMAFAMEQPDMQVLLFFIIPIKMKWLAWLDGIYFLFTIIGGYLSDFIPFSIVYRLALNGILLDKTFATSALVSMINFIVFAIIYKKGPSKTQTQKNFQKAYKTSQRAQENRQKNKNSNPFWVNSAENGQNNSNTGNTGNIRGNLKLSKKGPKHKCAVCGRTELDGDDLVFRFCTKCKGNYEYCQDHLYTHIHVTDDKK